MQSISLSPASSHSSVEKQWFTHVFCLEKLGEKMKTPYIFKEFWCNDIEKQLLQHTTVYFYLCITAVKTNAHNRVLQWEW